MKKETVLRRTIFSIASTDLAAIVVLSFFGFAIRLFWISHPAPWIDEIFSINYARHDVLHLISLTRDTDLHPPLYYLLLKATASLFGEGRGALRALSALFSGLSVPFLYLLVRERLGSRAAMFSALFFCLLPVNVHFGREMRTYSALAFFLLVSTYFFLKMMYDPVETSTKRNRLAVLFAFALAVTFHLHYSALTYFALFTIAAFTSYWFERDWKRLRLLLGAIVGAGLLCLPQFVHFLVYSSAVVGQEFWIQPISFGNFYATSLGAYPFPSLTKAVVGLAYLTGTILIFRKDPRFAVILMVFIVLGPLLMAGISVYKPVYLVRSIQAFTILSPVLIGTALAAFRSNISMFVATVVLAVIHIAAVTKDYPITRQPLVAETLYPTLVDAGSSIVFYQAQLRDQFEMFGLPWQEWQSVQLGEFEAEGGMDGQIRTCLQQPSCYQAILIMERSPRFQINQGKFWMSKLDELAKKHSIRKDYDSGGYRILILK